jgi:hypothetical protein
MEYAVQIERVGSQYELRFPDMPGIDFTRDSATELLQDVSRLTTVALSEYLQVRGDLPEPKTKDGLMIRVPSVAWTRLVIAREIHAREIGSTPQIAKLLRAKRVAEREDSLAGAPLDDVLRALEALGIDWELTLGDRSMPSSVGVPVDDPQRRKRKSPARGATTEMPSTPLFSERTLPFAADGEH